MIFVSRLNGKIFLINPDLIETMETTPDTVIKLTNEKKYLVSESVEEIINRIIDFRRRCNPNYKGD